MKLGARILKTGVAIVLALFVAKALHCPSPIFAGIAAIFALQPSLYRSYRTIIEQLQGNLIGAVVAVTFGSIFGHEYVAVGLAAIVTLSIMIKFKLEDSISLALVTMIVIMEVQGEQFIMFGLIRFATIMIGVLAAFVVNLLFLPPRYETRLFTSINILQDDIIRWIRLAVRQASEHTSTKQSLRALKQRYERINTLYHLYKEERAYFGKKKYIKARKLVVYRQMILTTKKSIEVLNRLHLHENEITNLPERFRIMIQERLDYLLTYHEQLFLKYTGKLKPEHITWVGQEEYLQRNEVMDIFAEHIVLAHADENEEEFSSYHLLHILSRILDYEENLEHLDTLIMAYQNHHSHELLKVEIEDRTM
ncbi:aromatic acid exporter family protein [Rummeliibacillus sp. SL167]|uniref:FUSC family protein n=1 Tax=Rummeliibacillus sp. SL167 TaxID=2579792 RepID=UPI0011B7F4EF|nr:aromatic acid exporter family protein [Rummeliibacillus sp. SL167]